MAVSPLSSPRTSPKSTNGTAPASQQTQTQQQPSGNTAPRDSVSLSSGVGKSTTGSATGSKATPVDPQRQDEEVPDQERRIEDQKAAATTDDERDAAEVLRPATGEDAERYNGLLAEADSLEPGTHETDRGRVEVTEEDGVKTLRYDEGDTQRIVTVDSNTGSASERVNQRYANGQAQVVSQGVDYHREGDTLAPVVDQQRQAVQQFQELINSPAYQNAQALALENALHQAQLQAQQLQQPPYGYQPSFAGYLRG